MRLARWSFHYIMLVAAIITGVKSSGFSDYLMTTVFAVSAALFRSAIEEERK